MEPRQVEQEQEDDKQFQAWVRKESRRLSQKTGAPGGPMQSRMLEYWELYRPLMWARLQKMGIAKELAHVLDEKCEEAIRKNLAAGMYSTDAREEAEKDWLLLEPEEDEEYEFLDDDEWRIQAYQDWVMQEGDFSESE